MTTSLGKRSSINGISDIAYTIQKAPVNTSGDQFIQGVKTFSQSINAFGNILCSGKYYGDGTHLTNVTGIDPSKLPLAGGTITGTVNFVNGSDSNTITALNQIFNDGNGNSNEIDNIKVFIREDGGGKDATYGLLSSQHRNENNFNSCLTEVGVNTDGNLGLSVKSQMDVDACTLFVGYNAGIPAQPEVSVSGNSFIKWNTGTSLRIRQQDGNKIEKFDAVQVNNGAYGQFDFYDYTHYLDAYGEGGWTVTLINPGNLPDPNVTSPDIYFVGTQFGVTTTFTLLKWTAARIILTPTTPGIYPYDFVWLVSF